MTEPRPLLKTEQNPTLVHQADELRQHALYLMRQAVELDRINQPSLHIWQNAYIKLKKCISILEHLDTDCYLLQYNYRFASVLSHFSNNPLEMKDYIVKGFEGELSTTDIAEEIWKLREALAWRVRSLKWRIIDYVMMVNGCAITWGLVGRIVCHD